jgi:hypothetical protein
MTDPERWDAILVLLAEDHQIHCKKESLQKRIRDAEKKYKDEQRRVNNTSGENYVPTTLDKAIKDYIVAKDCYHDDKNKSKSSKTKQKQMEGKTLLKSEKKA